MSGPVPTQVIVWRPSVTAGGIEHDGWGIADCLSGTSQGDRALVYQSGPDGAAIGVFDYATDAVPNPDMGSIAAGKATALGKPISRAVLLGDPRLSTIFQLLRSRRGFPEEAQRALSDLVGEWPDIASSDAPKPRMDEAWKFSFEPFFTWHREAGMEAAIADNQHAWSRLSFPEAPRRQVRVGNGVVDLYAPGLIAECKQYGDTKTLEQIDKYLTDLRATDAASPSGTWFGMIIVSKSWTGQLAEAVRLRNDVQLLVCVRQQDEDGVEDWPEFVEVKGADDRLPWSPSRPAEVLRHAAEVIDWLEHSAHVLAGLAGISEAEIKGLLESDEAIAFLDEADPDEALSRLPPDERKRGLVHVLLSAAAASLESTGRLAVLLGAPKESVSEFLGEEWIAFEDTPTGLTDPEEVTRECGDAYMLILASTLHLADDLGVDRSELKRLVEEDAAFPADEVADQGRPLSERAIMPAGMIMGDLAYFRELVVQLAEQLRVDEAVIADAFRHAA